MSDREPETLGDSIRLFLSGLWLVLKWGPTIAFWLWVISRLA